MNRLRLAYDLILAVLFFFMPWWALFLLTLPGLALYAWFGEVIVLGLAIDLLFRAPASGVTPLWGTLLALLLLLLSRTAKRGLRFHTPYAADTR
ncbi:MAG TPA: hypothetical protein VD967_00700 [Candidatus Paceibacterota bacterium]|nr:hypothetical protein [Candidatus Paceibacterota bacterium]